MINSAQTHLTILVKKTKSLKVANVQNSPRKVDNMKCLGSISLKHLKRTSLDSYFTGESCHLSCTLSPRGTLPKSRYLIPKPDERQHPASTDHGRRRQEDVC
jgi:hypothetical protein